MLRKIDKLDKRCIMLMWGYVMFKKLAQKLILERQKQSSVAINPLNVDFDERKSALLKKMTHSALNMYERKCDINNFTKLVLSDPENKSHTKLVEELFAQGVIDPNDEDKLFEMLDNTRFLRDLGLSEE